MHAALLAVALVSASSTWQAKDGEYLSFGSLPTFSGVAMSWQQDPVLHLYDGEAVGGHASYVSNVLGKGITFREFKNGARHHATRTWLPFFLYDLRESPITLEGTSCSWAARIEDYQYDDTDPQMAETMLRLLRQISQLTGKQGMAIVATSPQIRPNSSISAQLREGGFPVLTISELVAKAGGAKLGVFSPGTAIGTLRIATGSTSERFGLSDIVVYEHLPARVPPVAGIVSLEPETPLSHVALLALDRGTVNVFVPSLDSIPGAKARAGTLVRLKAESERISLGPATKEQLASALAARRKRFAIPAPDLSQREIVDLDHGKVVSVAAIGAKASNYATIRRALPERVRSGFALPLSWYVDLAQSAALAPLIAKTKPGDGAALAGIRQKILEAHLPKARIAAVQALLTKEYPGKRVRLRSSTNCEDLAGFNGAGLYLSKGLDADEREDLEKKLLQVYAALWTPLAYEEREAWGIDHSRVAMGVLIGEAFTKEAANAVAITIPTAHGIALRVNAQPGEKSVTNPEPGDVPESLLFPSASAPEFEIESHAASEIFAGDHRALRDQLEETVKRIHERMNQGRTSPLGIDVEIKLVREGAAMKLYVKQARFTGSTTPE